MDFHVETLGPCRKKVSISIPAERIQEEFDKKYEEINDSVALPGFRPGRAPRALLEKRFSSRLSDEVKQELVKSALTEMVDEKKVEPLQMPEIEVESLEMDPAAAMTFEFEVVTKPEFETPTYKGLEIKVAPIELTDEQIDAGVDDLRRHDATLQTVEDATVEEGDVLVLDWEAREGDSVEAHDSNVYYPIGRGVMAGFVAEGLDEQLLGKKVGAEASASVQVAADDPREELRDRQLDLSVTVKEIKRYILPEIDEKFLKQHDYDDEEELREDVSRRLRRALTRRRDRETEGLLVDQLLDAIEISLPEDFVARELEHWAMRKRMSLQMEQVPEEDISRQIDEGRDDTKSAIENDMRRFFLLDRVAEAEAVEVTDAEVAKVIQEMAVAYGRPLEEVAASFREPGRVAELRSHVRHSKAREIIRENAKLVEDAALAAKPKKAAAKASKKKAAKKKAAKKKSSK